LLISSSTLNIDRSRSVAVLKWVEQLQDSGPVQPLEIAQAKRLSSEESKAIQQRIEEQIQFGSLKRASTGVMLTKRGSVIVWVADKISKLCHLTGYQNL
jgi:hypothetical protein